MLGSGDGRVPLRNLMASSNWLSGIVLTASGVNVPTLDDRFNQQTVVWTDQLSDKSVWTTRASNLNFNTLYSVGNQAPWEYWIQNPFYWSGNIGTGTENNPYFATHGDVPNFLSRSTRVYTLKTDFSTRHWKQHTWKTGIEAKYNRVQNLSLTSPNTESNGLPGGTRSDFVNFNPEGAAYVQDRWEYEGLVLNAGVRYDVFSPGDQIALADLKSGPKETDLRSAKAQLEAAQMQLNQQLKGNARARDIASALVVTE